MTEPSLLPISPNPKPSVQTGATPPENALEPGSAGQVPEASELQNDEVEASRPPKGSIEEAAMKIDALLQNGDAEEEMDREAGENHQETEEEEGEPTLEVELDGEVKVVALKDLTDAYRTSEALVEERETLKARSSEIEESFQAASQHLDRLIPALERQLLGEFADIRGAEDLQALASANPMRYAEYQARQFALAKAHDEVEALRNFEFEQNFTREARELKTLLPELADPKTGDQLREDILAYGKDQGFDDQRFAHAGAREIAILYKAMKYDALEKGQAEAAARAKAQKRPARVMTPGAPRAEDPNRGYRQAMAQLKQSGHVKDAARVIELML